MRRMLLGAALMAAGCGALESEGWDGPKLGAAFNGKTINVSFQLDGEEALTQSAKLDITEFGLINPTMITVSLKEFPKVTSGESTSCFDFTFTQSGESWTADSKPLFSCTGVIGPNDTYKVLAETATVALTDSSATFKFTGKGCNETQSPDCSAETAFTAEFTVTK
jgi:hypothetical protein